MRGTGMQKRIVALWMAALLAVMMCAGCSRKKQEADLSISAHETQEETKETETETESTAEETTEVSGELEDGYMYSYLTGLPVPEELGIKRPVAVMLNNVQAAVPQSGINQAEVVYEAPAEGGINRFMAIFSDVSGLDKIGSVRSARTYFVYYAAEFQAIFVHYGQAKFAELHLQTMFCENLNGLDNSGNGVFFRTTDRPSPHNAYASGEGILAGIQNMGYWPYHHDYGGAYPYDGTYQFCHEDGGVTLQDGISALKVVPGYPINEPWFEYSPETGEYLRYQYGAAHVDDQGEQVSVKNILIVSTPCDHYYDTAYLDFHVEDGGSGYYITGGKAIPITWDKDWEWGITHYYDASGQEIELNPGRTWVCIVQQALENNIQITGSGQ